MNELSDKEQKVHPVPHDTVRQSVVCRYLERIGGVVATLMGSLALVGWFLTEPRLASLGQGLIPMAPSTAILFIVYGVAALYVRHVSRLISLSLFIVGALISLLLLVLSLKGVFLNIEHFGMHTMGAIEGTPIGHMSPITAGMFLLISLSFRAVTTARPGDAWRAIVTWWLAIMIVLANVMLTLAYLYGTPMFYGGTFIPPAATTSVAFLALGTVLLALARPRAWPETGQSDQEVRYSSHFLIVVFILLVAGVISAGYFYHRRHEKQYLSEIERQLSVITDLKMGELLLWREERLADAGIFYHNTAFSSLVKATVRNPESEQPRREIKEWISRLQSNHNYNKIFLLDTRGNSRVSFPESGADPLSRYVRQKALESLQTGQITFADFYHNELSGKIYLSILVPIFDPDHDHGALGVLALRVDPDQYLYPFIRRWPLVSNTAESSLVRKEGDSVLFLNELRFKKDSALHFRTPLEQKNATAVMAVMGHEGIVRGVDYRGHPVLAASRSIPGSPWYLVTRMDAEEVYAPMQERLWITVLLVCAMMISAGTGVGFVWRQQSNIFYRDRYKAELERVRLEERLTRIAASVPGAIFQYQLGPDGSSSLPYASSGLESLYGVRPEEVAHDISPLFAMIHPDDTAGVTATILESVRTFSLWHNEHRVVHPDRGIIWVEGNATPERKPDGSVLLHGFLSEVTERKVKERELATKNSELERFTYTVSHDLKSPLVTIKTFLGYLEEDSALPDKSRVQQDLGFMHNAADKMSQLLDELLELSRVGRNENSPEVVSFRDLAHEAVQLGAGRIRTQGITVEIGDSPVMLSGDRPRLVEIWQNLVENACKFMGSQEHPCIDIGVERCGRETVFFVRDNGIGIDPRFQSKIFGLFEKLEAGGEGTGLGLALVKRIVELYDGTIRVESAGEGQGATFFFTLPAAIQGDDCNGVIKKA